jgi:hypothetical protein
MTPFRSIGAKFSQSGLNGAALPGHTPPASVPTAPPLLVAATIVDFQTRGLLPSRQTSRDRLLGKSGLTAKPARYRYRVDLIRQIDFNPVVSADRPGTPLRGEHTAAEIWQIVTNLH